VRRSCALGCECVDVVSNDLLAAMPRAHLQSAARGSCCFVEERGLNVLYSVSSACGAWLTLSGFAACAACAN
jgi:hypothetical protein